MTVDSIKQDTLIREQKLRGADQMGMAMMGMGTRAVHSGTERQKAFGALFIDYMTVKYPDLARGLCDYGHANIISK